MKTITAKIRDNPQDKFKDFIEEIGGALFSESKSSKKYAVLKELEMAFTEAKDIQEGKKQGVTLEQVLLSE